MATSSQIATAAAVLEKAGKVIDYPGHAMQRELMERVRMHATPKIASAAAEAMRIEAQSRPTLAVAGLSPEVLESFDRTSKLVSEAFRHSDVFARQADVASKVVADFARSGPTLGSAIEAAASGTQAADLVERVAGTVVTAPLRCPAPTSLASPVFPAPAFSVPQSYESDPQPRVLLPEGKGPTDEIVSELQAEAEQWLVAWVPDAAIAMQLAADRLEEAGACSEPERAEVLAQALHSIRRSLSHIADYFYPARNEPALGPDGKEWEARHGAVANRLILALREAGVSRGRYRLERAELEGLHQRLRWLITRLSAGVHHSGDLAEARGLYRDAWRIVDAARHYLA